MPQVRLDFDLAAQLVLNIGLRELALEQDLCVCVCVCAGDSAHGHTPKGRQACSSSKEVQLSPLGCASLVLGEVTLRSTDPHFVPPRDS